jgi:hypothetical protein
MLNNIESGIKKVFICSLPVISGLDATAFIAVYMTDGMGKFGVRVKTHMTSLYFLSFHIAGSSYAALVPRPFRNCPPGLPVYAIKSFYSDPKYSLALYSDPLI